MILAGVRQISSADAKTALDFSGVKDPSNWHTNEAIAKAGFCVEYVSEKGKVVCVMRANGPRLWITGAAAAGSKDIAKTSLPLVEKFASENDLKFVCFQTGRKGLAKIAIAQGYKIVGYVLEKSL